jgi:hypothetical protein
MKTICFTCSSYISKGIVPNLCLSNGLMFPVIHESIKNLTNLEERLICPRIPFMRIMDLSYVDKQSGLRGNIVNVPVSVNTTVQALPRKFNDTYTIQLNLKKRSSDTHPYKAEVIRPQKIFSALNDLMKQELYLKENITLSQKWFKKNLQQDEVQFNIDEDECNREESEKTQEIFNESSSDEENENLEEQTLLVNQNEIDKLDVAPGEGQIP